MKAILYVVALLAIGGAAFFSNANKGKMEEQQKARHGLIEDNKRVSATADKTQKELNTETDNLKTAREEKAEVEQNIDKLKSDESTNQRELADLDGTLEEQQEQLEQAKEAVAKVQEFLQKIDPGREVAIDDIPVIIKDLEDQKKVLVQEIGELETTIESAQKSVDSNRAEIVRLGKREEERNARFARNAMESVITAVDQDWGFVVVGSGSRSGFTPQTRLTVMRGGRAIAEVRPSSIEATQTIAEIDWDTVSPGVRLQPGDRVILTKAATN
ncbi:MAG: hypothetical protein AAGB14_15030 [Verrucomicrobiota bacterium]